MAAVKNPEKSSFFSDIEDSALSLMRSWANRETLLLCEETRKFTFSIIVKQTLSLKPEDEEAIQILDCYKTFMKGLSSLPVNFPGTAYAKAIKARHRISDILRGIMRRRAEQLNINNGVDFLAILLADDNVTEENVLSLTIDLLLGGYETTAMLLAVLVKHLTANPSIMEELKEEHVRIMKNKRGERLGWDDYKKMEFTQCIINESLRVGNVVKFLHRETIKPIEYKGFEIPAGWKVLPIITGVHLDPSLHSDPSTFNPYRWKNVDSARGFMPFGGGKRMCPGYELSKLEASLFIHHLLLNYSWVPLNSSDWPISYPYLDFKDGFRIAIRPL
ncbi:cytochrome P450 724B1 [Dendrobium catenatum]|uniref:Cytochrome P450 724B1 n=1 Tax=Dendrobium catenatum TaxID=906689 RepID=A0A2I0VU03_9ASPA|nr:cytochrome P450 724B1 [Dendrobium catenatum]PKU66874.1 Cytochrome P450 724B1 [Dendrobium catenatum]